MYPEETLGERNSRGRRKALVLRRLEDGTVAKDRVAAEDDVLWQRPLQHLPDRRGVRIHQGLHPLLGHTVTRTIHSVCPGVEENVPRSPLYRSGIGLG